MSQPYAPLDPIQGKARKARTTRRWRQSRLLESFLGRCFEVMVGLLGLIGALLVFPVVALRGRPVFEPVPFIGARGEPYTAYRFRSGPSRLRGLPACLLLVRGKLALVGPRPLRPDEIRGLTASELRRMDVRPGLVSLYGLRKNTNIAFESEATTESEYIENSSLKGDLGLIGRFIGTAWASDTPAEFSPIVEMLGVPIQNLTMTEALDRILALAAGTEPQQVCFVNADCMNLTFRNKEYPKVLVSCGNVLADGIGVKLAGKLLKRPIIQNVNGTDLFPRLCEAIANTNHSIYLLGGREGVADGVRDWVSRNAPEAKIAGVQHGYFPPDKTDDVIRSIRESGASILLVAFGAPRQDLWIAEHLSELGVGVAMGVGGLFDFYSDRIPRAPQWLRELGLEWVFRLIQEPGRMWKRYLVGNAVFLFRIGLFGRKPRRFA